MEKRYCDKCGKSSNVFTVKTYEIFDPITDDALGTIECCEMCYDSVYDDGYGLSLIS